MTLFGSRIYGGMGQLGASAKVTAVEPWWLSGGVAAANCVAAYQPKGAAHTRTETLKFPNFLQTVGAADLKEWLTELMLREARQRMGVDA